MNKQSTYTTSNGTQLTSDDITNICNMIQSGVCASEVRKKYKIGYNRLKRILNLNGITMIKYYGNKNNCN